MEEKIKSLRKELKKILTENNVTYYEWKMISRHIEDVYEDSKNKSTL